MLALLIAQHVRDRERRACSRREKVRRPAEVEPPADRDLWQPDRLIDADREAELRRIEQHRRCSGAEVPRETEASFVDEHRADDSRFVQRQDVPAPAADVAKAGNRVALQDGLAAQVAVVPVVTVQARVGPGRVSQVEGDLVGVERSHRRTDESRGALRVHEIGSRDERKQFDHLWDSDGSAFRVAQDETVQIEMLSLPDALVGGEEERAVANQRSADGAAELMPAEGLGLVRQEIEEISRVECIVPEELEQLPAWRVRAGSRHDVGDRSRVAAVLRAEGGVVHLHLLDRQDRGLHRQVVELLVDRDAVHHEVDAVVSTPGGVEPIKPVSAAGCGEESTLRGRDRSGKQDSEVHESPPVEWHLLDRSLVDDMADRDGGSIDRRGARRYDDVLGDLPERELKVLHDGAAAFDHESFERLRGERRRPHFNTILAGRQRNDLVATLSVCRRLPLCTGVDVFDLDCCTAHEGARRIPDSALQDRRCLRVDGDGEEQQPEGDPAASTREHQVDLTHTDVVQQGACSVLSGVGMIAYG